MQFSATSVQVIEKPPSLPLLSTSLPPSLFLPPPQEQGSFFRLDLSISCNFQQLLFRWQKSPPPSPCSVPLSLPLPPPAPPPLPPPQEQGNVFLHWIYPFHAISSTFHSGGRKAPSFLPFHQRPGPYCTCGIPMVPIIQMHTQIPPIRISSLGYQFCQLFKILTYREVQNTGSGCRWKPCRQPYHNTY